MDTKRPHVLIIDDDEDIVTSLSEIVEGLNYHAVTAQTLPMALIKINNQSFDCILLDLCLKKVSGLKIVQQIRRNYLSRNHNTPIILHSGNLDPAVLDQQKNDIDDAIVKPSNIETINEKLIYWSHKKHIPTITNLSIYISNTKSVRRMG